MVPLKCSLPAIKSQSINALKCIMARYRSQGQTNPVTKAISSTPTPSLKSNFSARSGIGTILHCLNQTNSASIKSWKNHLIWFKGPSVILGKFHRSFFSWTAEPNLSEVSINIYQEQNVKLMDPFSLWEQTKLQQWKYVRKAIALSAFLRKKI